VADRQAARINRRRSLAAHQPPPDVVGRMIDTPIL
jgi:hypothetical protein